MEAALRTAYEWITKGNLDKVVFEDVRGLKGIKEAKIKISEKIVKIAIVSGLSNARKIMEEVQNGTSEYDFIEIMACPNGCIMGGGQPIKSSKTLLEQNVAKLRSDAIYSIDEKSAIRKSHESPVMKKIYDEYLEKPGSEIAHKLLHTTYKKRDKYGSNL